MDGVLASGLQDADGLPVEVKVRSKGDGLYRCAYTPTSPLKHTVSVTWGGVSIADSPFRVSCRAPPQLHPHGRRGRRQRGALQANVTRAKNEKPLILLKTQKGMKE